MNYQCSSRFKLIGSRHIGRFYLHRNCAGNCSTQYTKAHSRHKLNSKCLKHQTFMVTQDTLTVDIRPSRLLTRYRVYLSSQCASKTEAGCDESSKHLTDVSSRSVESNRTFLLSHQTSRLLQNNCFLSTSESASPMISNLKLSSHILSSRLVQSRHISSSAAISKPQLLKSPLFGDLVSSRNFSYDSFYTALAQSTPVQTTQGLLLDLHPYLPWWAAIPVATLAVRSLVVLPLAVHQAQVVARLAKVNADMSHIAPELNKEVEVARRMTGWDKNQAKRVFKLQLRQIYQKKVEGANCHPAKMVLLVFFQMPLWVCLSVSLRNITHMAQAGYPSAIDMRSQGALWFSDLTTPDPLLIPLMLLAVNLTLTEVHALRNVGKGGMLQKVMLNGSRIVIFVVAAAATINPSSVTYYWLCSSTFGLFQALLLMSPRVRRALAIPKMGSESPTPYADIARNLKIKIARIKELASR